MASPATSVARTQPSVGVPQRKRYSPPAPSLETAATEGCDWSAYTKPELRALIESAAKILGGATRELKSRKPSFPDSLSPHLIMAWLPLGDIPYALRVSNAWRAASEPTFHAVAHRSGLARTFTLRHKDTPWHETVRLGRGVNGLGREHTTHAEVRARRTGRRLECHVEGGRTTLFPRKLHSAVAGLQDFVARDDNRGV